MCTYVCLCIFVHLFESLQTYYLVYHHFFVLFFNRGKMKSATFWNLIIVGPGDRVSASTLGLVRNTVCLIPVITQNQVRYFFLTHPFLYFSLVTSFLHLFSAWYFRPFPWWYTCFLYLKRDLVSLGLYLNSAE